MKVKPSVKSSQYLYLIYIGFGSIISQILLIREFLVSFYGNELSIGIIFADWLIWIGVGSAAGNKIVKKNVNLSRYIKILIVLIPLIVFLQILGVKFARSFLYAATGGFLSIPKLLGFSFSILSTGCVVWGMLFTFGAKILTTGKEELWQGVNKAYIFESLGCAAGGLLFSFALSHFFSTIEIIFLLFLIAIVVAAWNYFEKKRILGLITSICFGFIFCAFLQQSGIIEHKINALQWSLINEKLTFVKSIDTKYQNLALLRLENQYTIFSNGRPAYNIPNTYESEMFVHSILVQRHNAKRVLIIGGGFNGMIREMLKYPVQEIEYVELDPALLPFIRTVLDSANLQMLQDSRVRLISGDGREYLSKERPPFDIIILNVGEPSTAGINRFYTREFYIQCSKRLTSEGIIAFSFPSSAEYITDEMKRLDASIIYTFKHVFPNSLIIPGDHAIMLGSMSGKPFVQNPDSLAVIYGSSGISSEYFTGYMYKEIMLPERIKYIKNTIGSVQESRLNTDLDPVTYYFDLLLWNKFLEGENKLFTSFTMLNIYIAGISAVLILVILIFIIRRRPERLRRFFFALTIFCTGFVGMSINLLLILNFQESFGSIYELLGAMAAVFLSGSAMGAFISKRMADKFKMKTILLLALIAFVCVLFSIPNLLSLLLKLHIILLTLLVTALCGGLVGILFGTINRQYSPQIAELGSIYAFDVFGSSFGALTACSLLLPVLGIQEMTLFLIIILLPSIYTVMFIRNI